ncbi:hypothetical protein CgunFtcFv8_006313 [Champsocephalus gunnari]|uniref:Uncharacterized protein n=1 Tax=Champsocephalus gunnari TaxID=52237 RepID=A0AAN8BXK9_CHAGU|nr:hypothetical protein CgunFtcFv8_006313 [Champsocephalus gunnari]
MSVQPATNRDTCRASSHSVMQFITLRLLQGASLCRNPQVRKRSLGPELLNQTFHKLPQLCSRAMSTARKPSLFLVCG